MSSVDCNDEKEDLDYEGNTISKPKRKCNKNDTAIGLAINVSLSIRKSQKVFERFNKF